ncbi:MAG: HEAT repeat domain-containing protein [Anaerolineales bacterium]|nr:HEAT repeat domain-containing protein [Anaerolineales bacterium]
MMNQLSSLWNYVKLFGCVIRIKLGFAKPSALIKFLLNPNWEIRWDAADFLDNLPDKAVITPVFNILQQESNQVVVKHLIYVLQSNKAWDELFLCLDSAEYYVRSYAASVLSYSGETRFVESLLKKMCEYGDNEYIYHDNIYFSALRGIVDKSSVRLIYDYLPNATPPMKKNLLELLGHSKDEQVFGYLLDALKDPNAEVREGTVLGLMHLGNLQAIPHLRELLNDPFKDIQDNVKMALHELENVTLQT